MYKRVGAEMLILTARLFNLFQPFSTQQCRKRKNKTTPCESAAEKLSL